MDFKKINEFAEKEKKWVYTSKGGIPLIYDCFVPLIYEGVPNDLYEEGESTKIKISNVKLKIWNVGNHKEERNVNNAIPVTTQTREVTNKHNQENSDKRHFL